ncbi:hypothetical protein B0675_40170 [Streptomyces sp. M41(2017)]|uniref:hypothetical protein n=1 Tax=Streptomyces sp. M41(2017) TaxID=1955065 RepID=UPI0009BF3FCA|nr:hypothetical protein [Streptomyces sp. M41(2017)]OQQ13036.1 hypothetical protein B0675_40170 [Streptomyces sp. M41(2017)]
MTGPEHYSESERLIELAKASPQQKRQDCLAAAQIHATLALAAATAIPATRSQLLAEMKAWSDVAATKHKGRTS